MDYFLDYKISNTELDYCKIDIKNAIRAQFTQQILAIVNTMSNPKITWPEKPDEYGSYRVTITDAPMPIYDKNILK